MSRFSIFGPSTHLTQNWEVTKPSASGGKGVVVTQAGDATEAGTMMLAEGGNAADAIVAAAMTLAVVEPWNSGLGGIGYGLIREANETTWSLDFGPVAPKAADASDYPLSGNNSGEIFGWPEVVGDVNLHGPLSFCPPTAVAGLGTLHDRFGRLSWKTVMGPAIACAKRGMARDWFSTVKITQMMHLLQQHEEAARIYLPDGRPPVAAEKGNPPFLQQGNLVNTLELLARDGWESFYQGEAADLLLADFTKVGARISDQDLKEVKATLLPARQIDWHEQRLFLPPNDCGGETLCDAIAGIAYPEKRDEKWFCDLARNLQTATRKRIEGSSPDQKRESCTTHLSACDADGMTISFTTTLLGLMGSACVLPRTGILMNNGMMWFDPRPGKPNSIKPSARPKSNMLPLICETSRGDILALGASGGRRIMSAVLSILADISLFGMSPEEAAHAPRIDVSSIDLIVADRRFGLEFIEELAKVSDVMLCEHAAAPLNFGCPSIVRVRDGIATGQPDLFTPWSSARALS